MEQRSNDWWRRAVRTLVQTAVGGGLVTLTVDQLVADVPAAYAPWVVIFGGFIASALQNYAEDYWGVKAPLKAKPSAGDNPVPGQ